MSKATFNLKQYRFENISATGLTVGPGVPYEMELKFHISFDAEVPEGCDFAVSIKLILNRRNDGEVEEAMNIEAIGGYAFEEGVEPYDIKEPLERTFAVSLLYGCMRPTLDTIVNNIGFAGLVLPYTLPLDVAESEEAGGQSSSD
ncbi:hypothetical protein EKK97_22755 [Billgrantia tianxiuensis]|jgi:preprotein translocase subunit SecB|uniref:Protein-export protein SecB n=1 Tax=Billgrantia tianxiuensis TaxID=2497861 RepID=A0A6I6SSV2_9GAMM|nr:MULTISPECIES: hypothetical protein [Halomonas]MCE8035343.1 hypothetical protein [Halomonas sp. MCCC 1A11057]QHC51854.1 hypothetical protein EKK97_22755 [Halomonas tianxiuensis]